MLRGTRSLLPELREADVVVGTTTATAVALAAWRRVGRLRPPLVGIVAGLLNRPWGRARRLTTLPLLRAMHAMLYGPGEAPGLLALDPRLAGRVHVNPFGVDTSFWSPGGSPVGSVLAIGNDGHRDWETLLRAAPSIDAEVRILTRHPPPATLPANVRWEPADWHRSLSQRRRRPRGVPLGVRGRRSRQGRAAAVGPERDASGVGLRSARRPHPHARPLGPDGLRDGENVLLVPPGDPIALAAAVTRVLSDRGFGEAVGATARESLATTASVERYAERLLAICGEALARP